MQSYCLLSVLLFTLVQKGQKDFEKMATEFSLIIFWMTCSGASSSPSLFRIGPIFNGADVEKSFAVRNTNECFWFTRMNLWFKSFEWWLIPTVLQCLAKACRMRQCLPIWPSIAGQGHWEQISNRKKFWDYSRTINCTNFVLRRIWPLGNTDQNSTVR